MMQAEDEFAGVASVSEVLLISHRLMGSAFVAALLEDDCDKAELARWARELRKGRAPVALVAQVQAAAKAAPRSKRPSFKTRFRKHLRRQGQV